MEAKWNIANPADQEKVGALALALGIDRVLAELLVQRGIDTFDVESKRKLIQITRQVPWCNSPLMCASQPSFQERHNKMHMLKIAFVCAILALTLYLMMRHKTRNHPVSAQSVRHDSCFGRDVFLDKRSD